MRPNNNSSLVKAQIVRLTTQDPGSAPRDTAQPIK